MESIKFWRVNSSRFLAKINLEEVLIVSNILGFKLYNNRLVQIVNNNNGERFETYVIKGKRK